MPEPDAHLRNPARRWEKLAIDLVSRHIEGAGVVVDQSASGLPDFRIEYKDGRTAIGEIGWATDPAKIEQWSYFLKQEEPQRVALPPGSGSWAVQLTKQARTKNIQRDIVSVITQMRTQGLDQLEVVEDWPRTDLGNHARGLGFTYMRRVESGSTDSAYCQPVGIGGAIPNEPNLLVAWVNEFLRRHDKLDLTNKLANVDANEAHVFLIVGDAAPFGIQTLMQHARERLPSIPPDLPSHITHLWLWPECTFEQQRAGMLFDIVDRWSVFG